MDLEKTIYYSSLFNIYGELLTQKQQKIIESYVFNNLSLGEIAENFNISRQAVLDSVNKACMQLNNYEEKLHILKNNTNIKKLLENVKNNVTNDKLKKEILELINNL